MSPYEMEANQSLEQNLSEESFCFAKSALLMRNPVDLTVKFRSQKELFLVRTIASPEGKREGSNHVRAALSSLMGFATQNLLLPPKRTFKMARYPQTVDRKRMTRRSIKGLSAQQTQPWTSLVSLI